MVRALAEASGLAVGVGPAGAGKTAALAAAVRVWVAQGRPADEEGPVRFVRTVATPAGAPGPSHITGKAGLPLRYGEGHPALQCVERAGSVRADATAADP